MDNLSISEKVAQEELQRLTDNENEIKKIKEGYKDE